MRYRMSNFAMKGKNIFSTVVAYGQFKHLHMVFQIAGALEENESLEALDINGNNVGPEGMMALANALKGKESLQRLEVSYNPIEASGAKALIDIIKFDMKVGFE